MALPHEIERDRKDWARGSLAVAWLKVERLVEIGAGKEARDRADNELRWAIAVAEEWCLDPQAIVDQVAESAISARKAETDARRRR
jgi:hypothetical protein